MAEAMDSIHHVKNGEPLVTANKEFYSKCCECGLVHLFRLRTFGDEYTVVAYRDDFLTDVSGRKRKKNKRRKNG